MDAYGTRLAKTTSDWDGQSSTELEVEVVWPKGSNVDTSLVAHHGTVVSAEATYVSGEALVDLFEWPIGAMFGLALGGAVLVLRLRAQRVLSRPSLAAKHPFRKRPQIRHRTPRKARGFMSRMQPTPACPC